MSMNEAMNGMMTQEGMTAESGFMQYGVPVHATPVAEQPVAQVAEQEAEAKPYTIRPLNARDIFPMTRIIRKIGLKDFGKCFDPAEIKAITETFSEEENLEDMAEMVGFNVVLKIVDIVLEHLPDAGEEVFAFLAGVIGQTKEEVAALPLDVFFSLLTDVFGSAEFVGFMKAVSRLVK